MALLKYFKVEKRGPPLPNPSGSLNQQLSSSAIEEANKEVTAILCDPGKRHSYLKISPEQKAIIARYAANHGIIKAVRQFSKDFPDNSLKETTIRGWKKTYLKELSSRKKAGKDMTIEKLPEKKTGRPLMLGDTLDKEVQAYTVYVKIFVVDLISLFSWLASIHENFSLSEVSPTKIFPTNFFV